MSVDDDFVEKTIEKTGKHSVTFDDQVRECIDISPKLDDTLSVSDLVSDESAHDESSGAVIKGGDILLEDLEEFQCTPLCSQIP